MSSHTQPGPDGPVTRAYLNYFDTARVPCANSPHIVSFHNALFFKLELLYYTMIIERSRRYTSRIQQTFKQEIPKLVHTYRRHKFRYS